MDELKLVKIKHDEVDDSVVYGKIDGLGHLIHTSELGNVEGGLFDDI